jgi:hypothetical protein
MDYQAMRQGYARLVKATRETQEAVFHAEFATDPRDRRHYLSIAYRSIQTVDDLEALRDLAQQIGTLAARPSPDFMEIDGISRACRLAFCSAVQSALRIEREYGQHQ